MLLTVPPRFLFQSLLCWIMVCKSATPMRTKMAKFSFNPCYVGLWSVSEIVLSEDDRGWLFQSLLCWIMVCKVSIVPSWPFVYNLFQSLLCWIMVCKMELRPIVYDPDTMFQSLLCWIMVCKKSSYERKYADLLFQSLLCWIMVCKLGALENHTSRLCVSILVMLDYGL